MLIVNVISSCHAQVKETFKTLLIKRNFLFILGLESSIRRQFSIISFRLRMTMSESNLLIKSTTVSHLV